MSTCKTEGCDGDATARHDTCTNCRAGVSRWSKRRPAEVLERRRKLTVYGARVDVVIERKDLGRVTHINSGKRRAS